MKAIHHSIFGSVLTDRFVYINQVQEEYKANVRVRYSGIYNQDICQRHPETVLKRAFSWSQSPEKPIFGIKFGIN